MTPTSIAILSLGMSADAFAAAVGRGAVQRPDFAAALRAGLVFGCIEAVTPLLGWSLGLAAAGLVSAVDHWIAFGLLGGVGTKMVVEAVRRPAAAAGDGGRPARSGMPALVATAIGTSIDAAAVGVTLAFLGADILVVALSIGLTTFVMATFGMLLGRAAGARLGAVAECLGGIALIGLGTAILLQHTGVIG